MGQFDFPSAAALDRLRSEEMPTSPAARLFPALAKIGGNVAEAIGFKPASAAIDICAQLMDVAPAKDEANLLYFAEWVVCDIRKLYALGQETRNLVEERIRTDSAGQVLANATLHVPRTNNEARLQRLAHIFANGVWLGDFLPDNTDDMMRAAVELRDADIVLLQKLYKSQVNLVDQAHRMKGQGPDKWHQDIQGCWKSFITSGGLNPQDHLDYRSSFSRLESFGLIQKLDIPSYEGVGTEMYALLSEGKKFCERVKEIGLD